MIYEYFAKVGCYISKDAFKAIVEAPDDWDKEKLEDKLSEDLYQRAYEITESCYGSHGFEDEEREEDEEEFHLMLDEHCYWDFEEWNDDEHAGQCTYGNDREPSTTHIYIK